MWRPAGTPNLLPEVGYTNTIGFVFKPSPDFSLAVDGYDILIKDAIINGYGPASHTA